LNRGKAREGMGQGGPPSRGKKRGVKKIARGGGEKRRNCLRISKQLLREKERKIREGREGGRDRGEKDFRQNSLRELKKKKRTNRSSSHGETI